MDVKEDCDRIRAGADASVMYCIFKNSGRDSHRGSGQKERDWRWKLCTDNRERRIQELTSLGSREMKSR